MSKDLRLIGGSQPIYDAYNKVTGRSVYTGDMKLKGMLYGKLVLSDKAHARVVSIDTSEAEKLDGVVAIRTVGGLDLELKLALVRSASLKSAP